MARIYFSSSSRLARFARSPAVAVAVAVADAVADAVAAADARGLLLLLLILLKDVNGKRVGEGGNRRRGGRKRGVREGLVIGR